MLLVVFVSCCLFVCLFLFWNLWFVILRFDPEFE